MDDQYDPTIQQVVRKYSFKIAEENPDDVLSQALGANAARESAIEREREGLQGVHSWQAWLQLEGQCSDQSMLLLEQCKKQVAERWKTFGKVSGFEDVFQEARNGPPRVATLLQAVSDAEATWARKKESGLGKTKSAIEDFMSTMNDYSYLFSVVPNGDKYTSLITGIVTSVVKASVNHKNVADQFSGALQDISEDLRTVPGSLQIANSTQTKLRVIDLYMAVFEFLCTAMEWYESRSKRFRSSFNKNYSLEITNKVDNVKAVLGRIRHDADQATQDRIKDTRQVVEAMDKKLSRGFTSLSEQLKVAGERTRENGEGIKLQCILLEDITERLAELGSIVAQSLLATGQATMYNQKVHNNPHRAIQGGEEQEEELALQQSEAGSRKSTDAVSEVTYTRDEILVGAAYLDAFLPDSRSQILTASSSSLLLPSEVTQRISRWIADPSSKFLWVEGPVSVLAERRLSLMAAQICESALRARRPVPCVFFSPTRTPMGNGSSDAAEAAAALPMVVPAMSRQENILISLLYCIASQLIHLLPQEFTIKQADDMFSAKDFEHLHNNIQDSNMDFSERASTALELINYLLALSPPVIIFILDKLQLADCPTTEPHIERLVALLRDCSAQGQIIKALFVTGGRSGALAKSLDCLSERVLARRMVQGRPGNLPKGQSSLRANLGHFGQEL